MLLVPVNILDSQDHGKQCGSLKPGPGPTLFKKNDIYDFRRNRGLNVHINEDFMGYILLKSFATMQELFKLLKSLSP